MKKVSAFIKAKINRVLNCDIKHYIAMLLLVLSYDLAMLVYQLSYERLIQNCIDFGRAFWLYVQRLILQNEDYTIELLPLKILDITRIIPIDFTKLHTKIENFCDIIFTFDNFKKYLWFLYFAFLLVLMAALLAFLFYYVGKIVFESTYLVKTPEEDKHKESKALKFFKKRIENKLICAYLWCKSFVLFLRENSGYLWALLTIWLFNFNLVSVVILLLAIYLYFISCFVISFVFNSLTITVDNGSEFSYCDEMERSNLYKNKQRTKFYYCHPYSSWERGSNENQNSFIRRFIPKGVKMEMYTQKQIDEIVRFMNTYPREILDFGNSEQLFITELQKIGYFSQKYTKI